MTFLNRTSLKIVAVIVGVLAAAIPIGLFSAWPKNWPKKQGNRDATITAAWAVGSSEFRIGQAIGALQDLSARGVDSCRPAHVEAMRQAALRTGPVKQIVLIAKGGDAGGDVLCTDTSGTGGQPEVLTSAATAAANIFLDVIRLPDRGDRFLRIRQTGQGDKPALAALVPVSLLLPQSSKQGGRLLGSVQMTMTDGTPVGDSGVPPDGTSPDGTAQDSQFAETIASKQFPLAVSVLMPRNTAIANDDDLRGTAMVIGGGIALILLLCALLIAKRQSADPMADMAKAIRSDEFVPYYQPVVDLQTGRLLGAEVLVRWRRPDGTLVEPNAFVMLLESSGLVLEFTRKLMRRTRKELGDAVGRRPGMTIAFNVAPRHFDDALILNDVGTIFDGSTIRLSQIVLEVTERHEVVDLTSMRRTIAALQRVGCKVAIDDVGTGHSGLSYILKLGVDIIKIDKLFVDAIGSEGHSKPIIETLIDLAKNMRMEIIAEGVETFDQVTYLRERGIGAAQGYVFAPPLPAATFLQLLEAMDPLAMDPLVMSKPAKASVGA